MTQSIEDALFVSQEARNAATPGFFANSLGPALRWREPSGFGIEFNNSGFGIQVIRRTNKKADNDPIPSS